jgi:hypothetical protein
MHLPIKVKSPNNISKWQMGFNSAFKGLKDEYRLMVCNNMLPMKVFGPKRDKVTGDGQE